MRSTTSFQAAGVCPAPVMRVRAWQAVQAVSTMAFGVWAKPAEARTMLARKRDVFFMWVFYTMMTMNIWPAVLLATAVSGHLSAQWLNYPTAGIPRGRDGKPNLSAPAPKAADGKPDLTGVWMADGQTYFFDLAAGR